MAQVLQQMMPVGYVYVTTDSTSPATRFGFGTWVQISGYLVATTGGTLPLETEGSNTRTLTTANMPAHSHAVTVDSGGAHTHSVSTVSAGAHTHGTNGATSSAGGHTHTLTVGSGGIHNHAAITASNGSHNHTPNRASTKDAQFAVFTSDYPTSPATGAVTGLYFYMAWGGANTANAGAHTHTVTVGNSSTHTHTASSASVGSGQAMDIQPQHYQVRAWRRTA